MIDSLGSATVPGQFGLWVGLLISLALASILLRDNALARLAQHILVGAGIGYATVLAVRAVLWPQVFAPLQSGGLTSPGYWINIVLLFCLFVAGTAQILTQGHGPRWLTAVGALPVAFIAGAGIAVAALGVVQGTLAPQFLRAAATGLPAGPVLTVVTGLLTLAVTSGAIVHLRVNPARDLRAAPAWMRNLVNAWAAIGRRGLWLAAGVIFARLAAARVSLLAARVEYLAATVQQTGIWMWFTRLWQTLFG